jgi:hypothetical protein
MKRVLSLLLLIPFLTVQAWALRGGPYDGLNGRSQSALAGTYGVVLSGNVLFNEAEKSAAPVNPETTGIMAMSVPGAGMASGRILIFAQGLMYLGNAQGVVDQRSNKITLVSQVSHYVAHLVTDGITRQSGVAVDAILSGKMDLQLSLDYFSGLIEVGGTATYFKYDPLLAQVVLDTNTSTAVNSAASNQNKNEDQVATQNANANQTATALQGAATDTSETKSLSQSVASSTTNTVTNPDGSTTTNSDSTATNANNLSGASTNTNSVSSDSRNSDLSQGSTVTAGTAVTVGTTQNSTNTVTTAKYRPDLIRQSPVASSFMALTAIGVRQDTTVEVLAPFTPPTEATSFQIEVAAPTTGGATGGAAPRPNA